MKNKITHCFLDRTHFQRYVDMYKLFLCGNNDNIEEKVKLSFLKFILSITGYILCEEIKNIEIIHFGRKLNELYLKSISTVISIMNKSSMSHNIYKYLMKNFVNKLIIINYRNGSRSILYIEEFIRIIMIFNHFELLTLNNNTSTRDVVSSRPEINIMENNNDVYQYLIENAYLNNFDNEIIIERTANITLEDFKKYYLI